MSGTHCHLAYLQQVSEILEDEHKRLAARLGYIAKKISAKYVIHVNGVDTPKLRRCKVCQSQITLGEIHYKSKTIHIKCSLCGTQRRYPVAKKKKGRKQDIEPSQDSKT